MARFETKVTLKGDYECKISSYRSAWETDTLHIYTMIGEDGKTYVWKTTSVLRKETEGADGYIITEFPSVGSIFTIKATVKGETEYKGQAQTEISRVVVTGIESIPMTPEQYKAKAAKEREERLEAKREEQKNSIADGDEIITMPYKQYKDHYSDCETVAGSFIRTMGGQCFISVIVRNGRMKASGVRGKMFDIYRVWFLEDGKEEYTLYKAVCEENAVKRFRKEFPEYEIIKVD